MAGPQTSYSDASSSSASFTAGAKSSGLTIAAPQATPNWLAQRLSGDSGGGGLSPLLMVAAVAGGALLVLLLVKKRG